MNFRDICSDTPRGLSWTNGGPCDVARKGHLGSVEDNPSPSRPLMMFRLMALAVANPK